jgi:transcriptional regulator with XRE-family HTH domain
LLPLTFSINKYFNETFSQSDTKESLVASQAKIVINNRKISCILGKNLNNPIPNRLKQARELRNISQRQLGIIAGISPDSASARMNQYETGKHTPDYVTLSRIAQALSVPTAYFYTDDNDLSQLLLLWDNIPKSKRKDLIGNAMNLSE